MKKEIHKIIKENFELNKNTIPWDGMYDEAVRKLLKLFEKKNEKSLGVMRNVK